MPIRLCLSCYQPLDQSKYSAYQWNKPIGVSRCLSCAAQRFRDDCTAYRNNASTAKFSREALKKPFAQGGFRLIAKGLYTEGDRAGEACVCKWFKTGHVFERKFFKTDMLTLATAYEIIRDWNNQCVLDKVVRLNIPQVWELNNKQHSEEWRPGMKVLIEPYIENFQKFNSNSGWVNTQSQWSQLMQALSHFSYHISAGRLLLCDLQGGEYSKSLVLSDPVILSADKSYGITDLGAKGITNFFSNHRCNQYCKKYWKKTLNENSTCRIIRPRAGTIMVA